MRRDPLDYLSLELDALKQQGLYRHLRILDGEQSHTSSFDHRQVVNLSSNNYLGLTTHPRLRQRAEEAIRQLGVGSGSVRSIAGTMDIHMELSAGSPPSSTPKRSSSSRAGSPRTRAPSPPSYPRKTWSSPTNSITPASSTAPD